MARAIWLLAALGPLVAACVAGGSIEPVREVAAPPPVVGERVAAGFRQLGLSSPQTGSDGTLRANLGNVRTEWAKCRPRLVGDGDGRRVMATANRRRGDVEVRLTPVPTGTRVEVRTRYIGFYRNTATGYTFETPCASTGAVEDRLTAAAAGEGGEASHGDE